MYSFNLYRYKQLIIVNVIRYLIYVFSLFFLFLISFSYIDLYFFNGIVLVDYLSYFICFILLFKVFYFFELLLAKQSYLLVSNLVSSYDSIILEFEQLILFFFCIIGMFLLVVSNDLVLLFLALELQSLSLYLLVGFNRFKNKKLISACFKYFILGAFSSGLFFFGFSILYGYTGIYSFNLMYYYFNLNSFIFNENLNMLLISVVFIFFGLFFKLGVFPFYFWLVNVYRYSTFTVLLFIAFLSKLSIIYMLIKFCFYIFYNLYSIWSYLLLFSGLSSIFIGSISASYQSNLRLLLVYSTISNIGYVLLLV